VLRAQFFEQPCLGLACVGQGSPES
jgi:hypothetical protein